MTDNSEETSSASTAEPAPPSSVNNGAPPGLPPQPYPAPPGWGSSAQPQAPTWPYAPGAYPQVGYPPAMYAPQGMYPPAAPDAGQDMIGPDHVPWKWYDMLLPASPLILGVIATVIGALTSNATQTATGNNGATGTRQLVITTIAGVGIYAFMFAMIWVFALKKYHVGWSALGVRRPPNRYWALFMPIVFGMYMASIIVSALVVFIFYHGKAPENPQVNDLTGGGNFSWIALILALITASIVAPIVEELFFRGMLYGWLRTRWNPVGGIILSGTLFSLAHGIALIFASILVVGITLAIVYEKTKSTLATMAIHSTFNTIGVLVVFIQLAHK
jgi:membrane protease YdiL (CAAX protease family)